MLFSVLLLVVFDWILDLLFGVSCLLFICFVVGDLFVCLLCF